MYVQIYKDIILGMYVYECSVKIFFLPFVTVLFIDFLQLTNFIVICCEIVDL